MSKNVRVAMRSKTGITLPKGKAEDYRRESDNAHLRLCVEKGSSLAMKKRNLYRISGEFLTKPKPGPEPGPMLDPTKMFSAWLYPGDMWLPAARMMTESDEWNADYLGHACNRTSNSILVALNSHRDPRGNSAERPFSCLADPGRTMELISQVEEHGFTPYFYLCTQWVARKYVKDNRDDRGLIDLLVRSFDLVKDHCRLVIPFWEIGEVWGGSDVKGKNYGAELYRRLREVSATHTLGCHNNTMEGTNVKRFDDVEGPHMTMAQLGHSTDWRTGAQWMLTDMARMAKWQRLGHISRPHHHALFEYAVPLVKRGQSWNDKTFAEAAAYGRKVRGYLRAHGHPDFDNDQNGGK